MDITVFLKVSKPIKKILTKEFGPEYKPSNREWLGILISSILEKKNSNHSKYLPKEESLTHDYPIKMKLSYTEKHGILLTKTKSKILRKGIEDVFRSSIYKQAILNKFYYGIDYKASIVNALDFYGITEDDKSYYQSIMRDFTRKKSVLISKYIN